MKIAAIQCSKCKFIIFSRARHDYRECKCKAIAIDGGFDYIRMAGDEKNVGGLTLDLKVDRATLYDDWNTYKDKWGMHTAEDIKKLTAGGKRAIHKVRAKK